MRKAHVTAVIDQGYDAVQRVLLDLDRFGFVLLRLHVIPVPDDDGAMQVDIWIGAGEARFASLPSRLERHLGVRHAACRLLPAEYGFQPQQPLEEALTC